MNDLNQNLLSVLTREGVLLNVSVRYWRGQKKLKPEDIGLDGDSVSDRLISLGHKRLLPKDATAALSLIEGRAHALVEANTFPFLNGLGHFLPNSLLQNVMDKLRAMESEFWSAKQEFLTKYSTLRANASKEWRRMAEKLVNDPDRLVATIEASFPHARNMDRFFGFDIQLFQISLPEKLGIDLVTEAQQQEVFVARQRAAQEAAMKIRKDTESFITDCVAALREQTANLCNEMLRSINECETGVHQKTLNRLIRFIDHFKQMNFANDQVMEQELETVRKELLSRTAEEYRDSRVARQRLVTGLSALADKAGELAKADASQLVERFGAVGKRKFVLAA
jgi:prophage DNA circulation protein